MPAEVMDLYLPNDVKPVKALRTWATMPETALLAHYKNLETS